MSLRVIHAPKEFREACSQMRAAGSLGLVPTMGALHAGHLALVELAKAHASQVALTLFVNPTQFGPNEDLAKYPRDLAGDLEKCEQAGVALVFAPDASTMYPPGDITRVQVPELSAGLCGRSRPGHFAGVATVVTKLFSLAGPCTAVFGRKDYQQFKLIQRMAQDLFLPVQVVGMPTYREVDGLAMSSRNCYLSAEERRAALGIVRGMKAAEQAFNAGERRVSELGRVVRASLLSHGLREDYVVLADAEQVFELADAELSGERVLLAIAAFCGKTRLIDNLVLGEESLVSIASGNL